MDIYKAIKMEKKSISILIPKGKKMAKHLENPTISSSSKKESVKSSLFFAGFSEA